MPVGLLLVSRAEARTCQPQQHKMPTFRVMTYNILFGGFGREALIRDVVNAVRPDVVVFNEVTSTDSFEAIADAVGPHRVAGASRSNREHPVIVSRWPILQADRHGPPWAPHKWVEARLQPFGGPSISICGVHLMAQPFWLFEAWRRAEVRSLLERLRPRADVPHVIAGDFNALVASDEFRREGAAMWVRAQCAVQGGWPRWALSALTNAGYTDCYRTCNDDEHGFTVPAWNPRVRIDYVFASSLLRKSLRAAGTLESNAVVGSAPVTPRRSLSELLGWKAVRSLGGAASDHLPVWADFEWPSGGDARTIPEAG